jgi:CRISPR-associated endonuclease/helicase Cas3
MILPMMTATIPEAARKLVQARARAQPVALGPEQVRAIPSQQGKRRVFEWHDRPLEAGDILNAHRDRTIAVVNRVARSQELYKAVLTLLENLRLEDRPALLLLHARFLPEDREGIEQRIQEHFKKEGIGGAILIATQVIEVGLDISGDVLHSEIAPAASVFQRAGRCARFEGEGGTVHIYALPLNDSGQPRYGPYLHEEKPLVDATAAEIEQHSGQAVDYTLEREIVDRVHSEADVVALTATSVASRREQVEDAIAEGSGGWVSQLIRQVDAITVLVHDQPEALRLDLRPQSFSIDRSVLAGFVRGIDLTAQPPAVQIPHFEDDERHAASVEWMPAGDEKSVRAQFLVCLHPGLASYCDKLGLELGTAGTFRSAETTTDHDAGFAPYTYHRESYAQHVRAVVAQARADEHRYSVARRRLGEGLGIDADDIECLVLLAAALHDVGKLSRCWQDAIWLWQQHTFGTARSGFLAHSDFDGGVGWQRAKSRESRYRKPPHAAEGAYAALPVLMAGVMRVIASGQDGSALTWALASSIARHHGGRTGKLSEFELPGGTEPEVRLSIEDFALPVRLLAAHTQADRHNFEKSLIGPRSAGGRVYAFYLHVARRVRLADQESLGGG